MSLLRNIVFISALAGLVAGLAVTGLQYFVTVPLILQAETFEKAGEAASHDHDGNAPAPGHEDGGWAPADGFQRSVLTALANVVTATGFAILLVTLSEMLGGLASWRQGVSWGLAGFAVFILVPSLGLPPEPPAMRAADLGARQVWWLAAVLATGIGLALLAFRRSLPSAVLAVLLIVAPHLVGAPKPASFDTSLPAHLARDFVVAALATSLIFWVLLGGTAGYVRSRFARAAALKRMRWKLQGSALKPWTSPQDRR
jgi:cobalt transporter subunit CbtA